MRLSRTLDALVLGEDSARSLGLALPQLRLWLVVLLAAATGLAVSQAGLVAFVGLAAPHLVRRCAPGAHGYLLLASALAGAVLLLAADVAGAHADRAAGAARGRAHRGLRRRVPAVAAATPRET